MDEENALSDLLEPSLPGAWIAEHHRIWQMDLLDADALGSFSRHRGLDSFYITITELWQLGLIKADLITSHRELQWVDLVDRGTDGHGRHIYSDERQIRRRRRTGKYASNNLKPLQKGIKLLFHPFRYYVLYHLHRFLKPYLPKIHAYSQNFLDPSLSFFKYWAGSEEFVSSIRKWNTIASLCIITEPCSYLPVFHSLRYSLDPVQIFDSLSDPVQSHQSAVQEIRQHMVDYWQNNVEQLYYRIGKERLEEIRIELGFNAKILDPNEWVQTLICLADSKLRLEVEGHLGGAVLLRTMAEMLRRASENAFNTQLPEEDELGFGRMKQIKDYEG